MIWGILHTVTDDMVEKMITDHLSIERLRGTKWERFVTDWS